ncbi:MAG TPA: hypothetical protein VFP72_10250 [Kineosporiaceae bacterium]|nr:hypothetical protein [Kineosporiaceae bacterium]
MIRRRAVGDTGTVMLNRAPQAAGDTYALVFGSVGAGDPSAPAPE